MMKYMLFNLEDCELPKIGYAVAEYAAGVVRIMCWCAIKEDAIKVQGALTMAQSRREPVAETTGSSERP